MPRGSAPGERRGGRKPGSINKVTAERQRAVANSGLMPLDFMIQMLQDENQTQENRKWAAKEAAPYLHPRLASSEHKVSAEVIHEIRWRLESP